MDFLTVIAARAKHTGESIMTEQNPKFAETIGTESVRRRSGSRMNIGAR